MASTSDQTVGSTRTLRAAYTGCVVELRLTTGDDAVQAAMTVYDPPAGATPDVASLNGYTVRETSGAVSAALAWINASRDDSILWQAMANTAGNSDSRMQEAVDAATKAAAAASGVLPGVDATALTEAYRRATIVVLSGE